MLILKDLSKSFLIDQSESRINVLNSLNLSIETGTTVALTGALTGTSATLSGALTAAGMTSTRAITGTTVDLSRKLK